MIPETGRRFGPYEILGRLGGGGMGHIFRAWDARLHREVAIKLLHNEYAMPGMRERFLREARAASALNHPHICTIFDIGEQDGDPYLVMELLEGETLKDRIERRTMQTDDIVCVGKEAAEALGAAHSKGVIHRDIKPANLFLVNKSNGGMQTKVLDFGLAKIEGGVLGARGSRALDITTAGSTVGTLAYMSPEQARGEVLDSRSDLFSLGVVLYEMATRQIPFPGATSALVFVKLLNEAPDPVRDWNEAIPRDLEKIIFKLMSKERTARFQTAHEVFEALSRVSDKGTGSKWLRKAQTVAVPLVRAPDPVVRERKTSRKRASDAEVEAARQADSVRPPDPVHSPDSPPRSLSEQAPQFLRPVARVPRGDTTPRPRAGSSGITAAAEEDVKSSSASSPAVPVTPSGSIVNAEVPSGARERASPRALSQHVDAHAHLQTTSAQTNPATAAEGLTSGEFAAVMAHEPVIPRRIRVRVSPVRIGAAIVVTIVVTLAAVLIVNRGHFGPAVLAEHDSVVVTEIDNRTTDKLLDGTVAEALRIALMQSPYLAMRSSDAYRTIRHQVAPDGTDNTPAMIARRTAERLGTRAYLYGTITGTNPPYVLHVQLLDTATNEVMTSAEESAPSLQQVPEAIDRIADDLRANVGEGSDSISRSHVPLRTEATTSLEALHILAQAQDTIASDQPGDAIRLLQQASTLEPRFVQAQLALAVLYRKQRAEVAASDAARRALSASDGASERTRGLAQYEYEMDASGDYNRALSIIRHLVALDPHDSQALESLARVLRLEGRMAESLQAAQQAYTEDPLNADAYTQAEDALIGLDRYDAAFQLDGQQQRLGIARTGSILTAAYLEGRQDALDAAIASYQSQAGPYRPDWNYGLYLDNIGHLGEAVRLWRHTAGSALPLAEMESASAFLLSQGSLDNALLGNCAVGLSLAHDSDALPQGLAGLFNSGMANALCGGSRRAQEILGKLQHDFPQSFAVNSFYLADLKAAIALHDGDPASALEVLKPARQFDLISLTPYLRGQAHVALRQAQIGIVDYQTVLAHRGVTFIVGSDVYPIAEIGVARAFADTGDNNNSAEAYKHFLELWKTADPNLPLATEARSHLK